MAQRPGKPSAPRGPKRPLAGDTRRAPLSFLFFFFPHAGCAQKVVNRLFPDVVARLAEVPEVTRNAALSACGRAEQWRAAKQLSLG